VGDWVYVTNALIDIKGGNNDSSAYYTGLVAQISKEQYHTQKYHYKNNWWHWLELDGKVVSKLNNAIVCANLRKATPEEIKKAQEPKYKEFPLGDYTAKITKDVVLIEGTGKVTAKEWVKLKDSFIIPNCADFHVSVDVISVGCVHNITNAQFWDIYHYLTN